MFVRKKYAIWKAFIKIAIFGLIELSISSTNQPTNYACFSVENLMQQPK